MAGERCPHCQASLGPGPEAATFCAACGRRIAGWSTLPDGTQQPDPHHDELPGGDAQTRQMEPTPSLLRAAAIAKQKRNEKKSAASAAPAAPKRPAASGPVETDSALMRAVRHRRAPLVIALSLLGAAAAAGAFVLVQRATSKPPPAPPPPTTPVAVAPIVKPPVKIARAKKAPHRIEPVDVPSPRLKKEKPGALPHKKVAAESTPIAATNVKSASGKMPQGQPTPVMDAPKSKSTEPAAPPPEDLPSDSTPMTEEEAAAQDEASIDADQVRFVVKSHLSQVHACYERAFKDSSPGGRVEIGFAIKTDGRASKVRTETNTTDSEILARCLESCVKEWKFPRPSGGEYELIYPFVFSPGS